MKNTSTPPSGWLHGEAQQNSSCMLFWTAVTPRPEVLRPPWNGLRQYWQKSGSAGLRQFMAVTGPWIEITVGIAFNRVTRY